MDFDVIIIGSGPAGATMATFLAKEGKKVLITDKKNISDIGKMPIGGVIDVDTFSTIGFDRPKGDELLSFIDTYNIHSPTGKTKKTIKYSSIIVDRGLMGQRLIGYAKEAGAELKGDSEFSDFIVEDGYVKGIILKDGSNIKADLVVDASGLHSFARKKLPDSFNIQKEIDSKDLAVAHVELLDPPQMSSELNSFLSVNNGQVWQTSFEVGVGSLNHDTNLKETHKEYSKKLKVETDPSHSYNGSIAVRQNLPNMVGNGFIVIGDAACMVSPIDGAGVKTSMVGAKLAAEIIASKIGEDVSQESLWEFNVKYNRTHGARLAFMDMLRRGVVGLKDDDIDFAFKKGIITENDVLDSMTGDITDISMSDKASRALKGFTKPHILLRLENCVNKSKELKKHYENYPENFSGLNNWIEKLNKINNSFT